MLNTQKVIIMVAIFLFTGCTTKETIFQGYIEADYNYISSAVSGKLTHRFVNRGDKVIAGQPLFILDPQPEMAKLEQAKFQLSQAKQQLLDSQKGQRTTIIENIQAQLKQKQAELEFASKNLERISILYKDNAIDATSFDQANAQYKDKLQAVKAVTAQLAEAQLGARENQITALQAAVATAQTVVDQAKWAFLQKSVRAPIDAQIFNTFYEPGEFVVASQPIIALLSPKKIKAIFFINEYFLNTIAIGDEISITCDSCKDGFKAKINFISPNAEFTPTATFSKESRDKLVYRIEAAIPLENTKKFHPGQPIDIKLINH